MGSRPKLAYQFYICISYLAMYLFLLIARARGWVYIDDINLGILTALVPSIMHYWIGSTQIEVSRREDK